MKLAFLKNPQEFRLRVGVEISDFIEEQSAIVGHLKLSPAHGGGPGEGTFLVAEELALNQLPGNCCAIHFYKLAVGKRAVVVDVGRQQLLACSRFAHQ